MTTHPYARIAKEILEHIDSASMETNEELELSIAEIIMRHLPPIKGEAIDQMVNDCKLNADNTASEQKPKGDYDAN